MIVRKNKMLDGTEAEFMPRFHFNEKSRIIQSPSVAVPRLVPTTITLAPIHCKLSLASTTLPVIINCSALKPQANKMNMYSNICLIIQSF